MLLRFVDGIPKDLANIPPGYTQYQFGCPKCPKGFTVEAKDLSDADGAMTNLRNEVPVNIEAWRTNTEKRGSGACWTDICRSAGQLAHARAVAESFVHSTPLVARKASSQRITYGRQFSEPTNRDEAAKVVMWVNRGGKKVPITRANPNKFSPTPTYPEKRWSPAYAYHPRQEVVEAAGEVTD